MQRFRAAQDTELEIDVTLRDQDGATVTGYDGTQGLATTVWPGGSDAVSFSPATAWLPPPQAGRIRITVTAAETGSVAPGLYQLRVVLTDAGIPVDAYEAELEIAAEASAAVAPVVAPAKPGSTPPASLAVVYCTDEDIACRAPQDFSLLCPRWQVKARGTDGVFAAGATHANVLTSASCDFASQGVAPGNVVALTGPVSTFRTPGGDLFAVDQVAAGTCWLRRVGAAYGTGQPAGPAPGLAGVCFEVRTFGRQIDDASYDANKFFGIDPNIPYKVPARLYDLRELQQYTVLTVLRRAYIACEKADASDFKLKLDDVSAELEDLKGRLVIHWGALAQGNPATSVFSARTRR